MKKVTMVKKEKVKRYIMVVDFTKEEDIQKLRNYVKEKFTKDQMTFQWITVEDIPNGYMGLRPPGIERYSMSVSEMLEAVIVIMKFGQIKSFTLNQNSAHEKVFDPEFMFDVIVTNPLIKEPDWELFNYDQEIIEKVILK